MKKSATPKSVFCIFITILILWLMAPTLWSLYNLKGGKIPAWLPKTQMRLGLDLQGGVHMVLGADIDKVIINELNRLASSLQKDLEKEKIKVQNKVVEAKQEIEILATSDSDSEKAADFIKSNYGVLEYVGSSGPIGIVRIQRTQEEFIKKQAIDQSIQTIRNRIDEFGVAEPIITRLGEGQILVQFPGADDPERLKGLIGQTAQLNFQIVPECTDQACLERTQGDLQTKIKAAEEKGGYSSESFQTLSLYRKKINEDLKEQIPANTTIAFSKLVDTHVVGKMNLVPYLLSTTEVVSGEHIKDARVTVQSQNNIMGDQSPVVSFEMSAQGAPLFKELTSKNLNHFMAIVLDGVVKSAPRIKAAISDSGVIELGSGDIEKTTQEANDTAIVLRAGALPTNIEILEERNIGPSMGADSIETGKKSLISASILVFIFMWIYYGFAGFVANLITILNLALIFGVLGSLGAVLTLPGIAGVVLTLGMAVDAFIILFERMRDEMRAGRSARQVLEIGFDNAFRTILDANITTAIGAYILLQFGTGSIRGFALTLLVGIVTNVFMATYFAKAIFEFISQGNRDKFIGIGVSNKLTTSET